MDLTTRNRLRNIVTQCRRLVEESVSQVLQGEFGVYVVGKGGEVKIEDASRMGHLSDEDKGRRKDIIDHFEHVKARGYKPVEALEQLVREVAFTHLNRLCAYKMMEVRDVWVGGKRFREAVSRGLKSQGFQFYLADHPEDEWRASGGQQDLAYRHFLQWLGGTLSEEIGVLFAPTDPANRLFPSQRKLNEVLDLLNGEDLKDIWSEDEAIGWVYQYFTPKELKDQARKESQAPRNSYELAFRNQFFTPRYVVEFLTDNTLGRIWYEMRKGETRLKDECRHMVRRPTEVFLRDPESLLATPSRADWVKAAARGYFANLPEDLSIEDLSDLALVIDGYDLAERFGYSDVIAWADARIEAYRRGEPWPTSPLELWLILFRQQQYHGRSEREPAGTFYEEWRSAYRAFRAAVQATDLPQEELLRRPVFISHRPKKDPREIKVLDPACGSGHFLLYCFALLLIIYEEAYDDPDLAPDLKRDYSTPEEFRRAIPGLILARNLHGIDIDPRAVQIAALALWLRAQKAYKDLGLKGGERPSVTRTNVVCAEPMPGEEMLLEEFLRTLRDDRLETLMRRVLKVPEGTRVRATQAMADSLGDLVRSVWRNMKLAGEAGTLLKIEEDLQGAIAAAQDEWEQKLPLFRMTQYEQNLPVKESYVRLVPGEQETFWGKAEGLVLAALDEYSRYVGNGQGLVRRLFADDAALGFAFIDLCRQRFDVVLMNPPFGLPSRASEKYVHSAYPEAKYESYGQFLSRTLDLCHGLIGTITSRGFFYLANFIQIREFVYPALLLHLDLGEGILDDAMVEVCAYVLASGGHNGLIHCIDARDADLPSKEADKVPLLLSSKTRHYRFDKNLLETIESKPFCYDTHPKLLRLFGSGRTLETVLDGFARVGLATGDNERFVRCYWEVPQSVINHRWKWHAKGGDYLPFKPDVHLVVDWQEDGRVIEETFVGARIKKPDVYFRPAVTFSLRSQKGLSFRALPEGCICGHKGPVVIVPQKEYSLLSFINSTPFKFFVYIQCSFASFEIGTIQRAPVPEGLISRLSTFDRFGKILLRLYSFACSLDETDVYFGVQPSWLDAGSVSHIVSLLNDQAVDHRRRAIETLSDLDDEVYTLYDWTTYDRPNPEYDKMTEIFFLKDPYGLVSRLIVSVCMNCSFGRYFPDKEALCIKEHNYFAPMPQGQHASCSQDASSPVHQASLADGILVDDPDHPDDIVRRIRDVLELLWKDRAEAIEREACEILGVSDLRDYVRRPGKGGLWLDHVARYSKSRRKAPIYWLLQSTKKSYALWIYYHRLDRDLLFKALINYVEPKIRLEEGRLDPLRTQRAQAGTSGKGVKQMDKQIEKQEALLSELRDFEAKLRRAANLHLEPDLNDGVVLNIAPLRELVPWKEAKAYWDELLAGKYEWSSIGKQLRDKGLVK